MPKGVNNKIKIVWFFEITQFKSEYYINETVATFIRGDKDYIYFAYEYNDHPKLFHWTYDWVERMRKSEDAYVLKTNYNDAPDWQLKAFLGELMLKEIARLKDIDPEQYKSTYLGLPANLGGSCYKLFSRDRNVRPATYDYFSVSVGVDYGANDATAFTASGFTQNASSLEIFKTYYHKNGEMGVKDINQYVEDLVRFLTEVYLRTRKLIQLYIDPANLSFIQLVERALIQNKIKFVYIQELKKRSSNPNKSSVQERIDITEVMFGAGYLTIDPSCDNLIKAYEQAEYNDKGERADDGRSDIDSLDSAEYSWLAEKEFI
jgi:PBSX family phage terminase large subunit